MADPKDTKAYLEQRYSDILAYYWRMSVRNKRAYKWSRYLAIALGSAVTLIGSLSAFKGLEQYQLFFSIATPSLAAVLTIISGFTQSFQWGASWREMVLTAERLQKEFDRAHVTPQEKLDVQQELVLLNSYVISESVGFFDRVMGSSTSTPDNTKRDDKPQPEKPVPQPT